MVINMDSYYTQDRLQELWNKINSLHLVYLGLEESLEKMEQRNKLEDYINDYLCMSPHDRKFYLRDTAEVLHRSASNKADFSGYKAVVAWNAIGRYAGNLLSQPWRREYREIKMYSGFYKHQIEGNLVGAEVMFEAMGYKYYRDGILILDGPICPDRVTQVSQDSIVAYVECQILKSIWEQVSTNFTVSWLDVLEFREVHLCGPKQAVQSLIYRFHQRQYQDQRCYSQGSEQFAIAAAATAAAPAAVRYPTAVHHSTQPMISTNHSYPPLTGHMQAQHTPLCIYPHNGYYPAAQNYSPCTVPFQYNTTNHPMIKPQYTNGYCYTNGYLPTAASSYIYPVPTGQLIELEHTYDVPDGHNAPQHHTTTNRTSELNRNKNENDFRINNNTDKEEGSGTFESWDYVYKNLESQGYSKDLGERGDILSLTKENMKKSISKSTTDLEEALANLTVDRPLKITEGIEKHKQILSKLKETERNNRGITPSSSYDNLSAGTENVVKKQITSTTKSSKTLPREKTENVKHSKASTSKTIDKKSSKVENEKVKQAKDVKKINGNNINNNNNNNNNNNGKSKWSCKTCTYLNNSNVDICQMCFKSKSIVSQDMEVGGSQCPNCTLVNPKNYEKCEACNANLKNSPTYI